MGVLQVDDYEMQVQQQAKLYASKSAPSLDEIRELLILSCSKCCTTAHEYFEARLHDRALLGHLLATIRDADDFHSGDARIEAAFYLGKFDPELLHEHSQTLLELYDAEDGEGPGGCLRGLLALSLAAGKVAGGQERVVRDLAGRYFDRPFFAEAIQKYKTA